MSDSNSVTKKNVLGGKLKPCCFDPMTGFFRDGLCRTDDRDRGRHIVCAEMTAEFLDFTKKRGNNLSNSYGAMGQISFYLVEHAPAVLWVATRIGPQ